MFKTVAQWVITIVGFILVCLYSFPNPPKLSIEEFSVPAFNKSSDKNNAGNIYFDLKLRNMNKAIGLYYDDPFSFAFSYYPLEEPYQKYVWVGTVPAFYQGNGKTKHIRALTGNKNNLQLPFMVAVVDEEEGNGETNHAVRSLLRDNLLLPSTLTGNDDVSHKLAETLEEMVVVEKAVSEVVNIRIQLAINYRFKYWVGSSTNEVELGADVMVDANTGDRVSAGSIKLVESDAAAGRPVFLMVFFTPVLVIMCL